MKRPITHAWFCVAFTVIFFSCAVAPEVKESSSNPGSPNHAALDSGAPNNTVQNPGVPDNTVQNPAAPDNAEQNIAVSNIDTTSANTQTIAAPNADMQEIDEWVFEPPIVDAPVIALQNIDSSGAGVPVTVMPEMEAPNQELFEPENLPAVASLPVMETPLQETVLQALPSITLPAPPVETDGLQVSGPPERPSIPAVPEYIMGEGLILPKDMTAFLLGANPEAEQEFVENLMYLYIEEAAIEGVNHDAAFAQMCLETGFLRFGGLVTPDMNNFCGLGAIGPGLNGESFPDPRTGVRAHIQHLKAYATDAPLKLELVDPRYFLVRFGSSPAIKGLAGTWAVDLSYAEKIKSILERLYSYVYGT